MNQNRLLKHSQIGIKRGGFTLIEMLAVITIIVILAALTVKLAQYGAWKALESRTRVELTALSDAIESYKQDTYAYPATGISSLYPVLCPGSGKIYFTSVRSGKGGNFNGSLAQFIDPYGNAYNYTMPGTYNKASFDLWSNGPNGTNENGGGDDIPNWKN